MSLMEEDLDLLLVVTFILFWVLCILAVHLITEALDRGNKHAEYFLEEAENAGVSVECTVEDSVIDKRHCNTGICKQHRHMLRQEHAKRFATEHEVQE